ncbi:hypothetical protein [Candidatus Formimonas warabiya]|uniref:Uncharacterized protein n=1 Tax=Formimonas warabiya TaxID=1761012 RepID=A0A3G1L0S9_FORW1|nr:hypothetical protein [Candidatus Formimonas warabiya]ATW28251.1 hypothetical protein DCMF_28945 [Candidatus Formimonas warabiya]
MNDELRGKIMDELCTMVERNPSLLKMFELLDRLYRDVEKMKQELLTIKNAPQPNHLTKFQDFVETMLFSLSEIDARQSLEQKIQEQGEAMKQKEEQLKEAEAAYRQIAAAQAEASNEVYREMERKNALLAEIKSDLSAFCTLPKTKRWQLILNEDHIISHFKGLEEKIDQVMG